MRDAGAAGVDVSEAQRELQELAARQQAGVIHLCFFVFKKEVAFYATRGENYRWCTIVSGRQVRQGGQIKDGVGCRCDTR